MTSPDLQKLAEDGRRSREQAAESARTAAATFQEESGREELEEARNRARRASSAWGFLGVGSVALRLLAFWVFAMVLGILLDGIYGVAHPSASRHVVQGYPMVFFPLLAGAAAFLLSAGPMATRGLKKERAWLRSLPYQLPNYEDLLGLEGIRTLTLKIKFVGAIPSQDLLTNLLASDGNAWTISILGQPQLPDPGLDPDDRVSPLRYVDPSQARSDDSVAWASGFRTTASTNSPAAGDEHNRALVRWLHRVVPVQLQALHAQFPIEAIRFELPQ